MFNDETQDVLDCIVALQPRGRRRKRNTISVDKRKQLEELKFQLNTDRLERNELPYSFS
ncbi:hypothetical protein [Vibrio coralliilyticus]|uniref:hypothetical protein n=1 Tax=Vibrio coralliilyticus TaxID=190893 RepID=UPI000A7448ED|nr:hypothetical protein [Vibrio coralliilyticus]